MLVIILLVRNYSDGNFTRSLVDYVMPLQPLKAILNVVVFFTAARLIGGKTKDYSQFFYKVMVLIFGDLAKAKK
jgi:hypothetical protein